MVCHIRTIFMQICFFIPLFIVLFSIIFFCQFKYVIFIEKKIHFAWVFPVVLRGFLDFLSIFFYFLPIFLDFSPIFLYFLPIFLVFLQIFLVSVPRFLVFWIKFLLFLRILLLLNENSGFFQKFFLTCSLLSWQIFCFRSDVRFFLQNFLFSWLKFSARLVVNHK